MQTIEKALEMTKKICDKKMYKDLAIEDKQRIFDAIVSTKTESEIRSINSTDDGKWYIAQIYDLKITFSTNTFDAYKIKEHLTDSMNLYISDQIVTIDEAIEYINKLRLQKQIELKNLLYKIRKVCNGKEFELLRRKYKQKIFDSYMMTELEKKITTRSGGACYFSDIGDIRISFLSDSICSGWTNVSNQIYEMELEINSKEVSIEEAIKYLEGSEKDKLPLAILNTSILTTPGSYHLEDITLETARDLVYTNELDSAVGHQSTAEIMSTLLNIDIPVNRQMFAQHPGQQALVFKLNGRPEEGKILSVEEIEQIGYKFQLLTRLQ